MMRAPKHCGPLVTDVDLARAERLFDEGDAGDRLYVVLEGKIKLTRPPRTGGRTC